MKQLALILLCHLTLFGQLYAEEFPSFANCNENGCQNLDVFGPLYMDIDMDFGFEDYDCLSCDSNSLGKLIDLPFSPLLVERQKYGCNRA